MISYNCAYIMILLTVVSKKALPSFRKVDTIWKQCLAHIDFKFIVAFNFCRFCVIIRFYHPHHNGQWPPTSKDFYPRSYPLHFCSILILQKEPVFPFLMLSANQGNYWFHFYNVFGMTRSLTGDWTRDLPHLKPTLYQQAIK